MPNEADDEKQKKDGKDTKDDGGNDEQKPRFMTADEFNKAMSAREKRLLSQFEKSLEAKLANSVAKKAADDDADDDDAPPAKPPASGASGSAVGNAATGNTEADRRLAKLEKQLAKTQAERDAEKKAREEQTLKAARDEERSKLSEVLADAGVDPKRSRAAIALLHSEDKRVRRNDEGKIVFVQDDGDEVDLKVGVKKFLETDEGKVFLPPRPVAGSGNRGGMPPTGGKMNKKAQAEQELLNAFLGIAKS